MITSLSSGDTAWMLVCAVLGFLMVFGPPFYYSGLRSHSNPLSLTPFLVVTCGITLEWMLFGYSLAFGPDHNGWIGTLAYFGLRGVGAEPNLMYAGTVPHTAFMIYQGMLALVGPAILLVALSERLRFRSILLFVFLWSVLIYDPVAHWVWSVGGFLRNSGAVDFAGGAVVHVATASTILAVVLVNPRNSRQEIISEPDSACPVALAALFLWLGGLSAVSGNSLGTPGLASGVLVATQISACAGGFTWVVLDRFFRKKLTSYGPVYGILAGLIAATSSAGYVTSGCAFVIGILASMIGFFTIAAIQVKFENDMAWEILGLHWIGGALGMLMTGILASTTANSNGVNGLFFGNAGQMAAQMKATLAVSLYSFAVSFLILYLVRYLSGLGLETSDPPES